MSIFVECILVAVLGLVFAWYIKCAIEDFREERYFSVGIDLFGVVVVMFAYLEIFVLG